MAGQSTREWEGTRDKRLRVPLQPVVVDADLYVRENHGATR